MESFLENGKGVTAAAASTPEGGVNVGEDVGPAAPCKGATAGGGKKASPLPQVAVIDVDGMTCAICVGIVENMLRRYIHRP